MGKYFPKLTQKQVRIDVANGEHIMVDMLPINQIGDLAEISDLFKNSSTQEEYEECRNLLLALVKTVMPEDFHENLARFDVLQLSELAGYLAYGDNDDEAPKEKSKDDDANPKKKVSN